MSFLGLSGPLQVQLEVTEVCDNSCGHCYNHWREQGAKYRSIAAADAERVVEGLLGVNVQSVAITGGEPLMAWDVTLGTLRRLVAAGVNVSLNSNLRRLTRDQALALKDLGLSGVLTSVLSGRAEVHDQMADRCGAFADTIAGIATAKEVGLPVAVNMVLTGTNLADVELTARKMTALGVRTFFATPATPPANSRCGAIDVISGAEVLRVVELLLELKNELGIRVGSLMPLPFCFLGDLDRYRDFGTRTCNAGVLVCQIACDGTVRACNHASFAYGNMLRESLASIWARMSDWRAADYVPDDCRGCRYVGRCRGGCRVAAFVATGNMRSRSELMSDPSKVRLPIVALPRVAIVASTTRVALRRDLWTREEPFGAVAMAGTNSPCFVDVAGRRVLEALKGNSTVDEIAGATGYAAEDVEGFVRELIARGLVVRL